MVKTEPVKTEEPKECPECKFAGTNSDAKKFSEEQIQQYPRGFASENHPKIKITQHHGKQIQEFAKDKNNEIIFDKIFRCPVCGYSEVEQK